MLRRRLAGIAITVAILQTVLASIGWLVFASAVLFMGPGIDYEKPNHHVSLSDQILEPAIILGPPLLCLTLAAILSWRGTRMGWWFSVLSDLLVLFLSLSLLIPKDIRILPELSKHPALFGDVLYHLALFVLPGMSLILLFTRAVRSPVFTRS